MSERPDFRALGYARVAAVAPALALAEPMANAATLAGILTDLKQEGVQIALFPELSLTGYTCEDLFFTTPLQSACRSALASLAGQCHGIIAVVGLPWALPDGRLLNAAAVLGDGRVLGVVPKSMQPNYGEFYEMRWFVTGQDVDVAVDDATLGTFRVATNQLFDCDAFRFGVEICEDLWVPEPPGIRACLAGAELVLNLSASNEAIAKADYRRDLLRMTSARGLCGYAYASSGALESTKDIVFGGHLLAAENGTVLAEGERYALDSTHIVVDFDIERLRHERMSNISFASAPRGTAYHAVPTPLSGAPLRNLHRPLDAHPFVPEDEHQFDARAQEILAIQSTGLARRMLAARCDNLVIGLSGGLDSTQAYLVALAALDKLGLDRTHLHAITMPGPGTTEHTRGSAHELGDATGVAVKQISIEPAVVQHLADLEHDAHDVVFENAQARERTQILFNYANKHGAIVVGTGDLSELALGWCTFNADHMANYNVNASVPKTMMRYLVRWYANHHANAELATVLNKVLETPISPELLPTDAGAISQHTEEIIGPYELHDFFLYHYLRAGAGPAKLHALAALAFEGSYEPAEIKRWLAVFFRRFYTQQFKRTTLPPGPKVGTVSLSPRGDWRMPDEAGLDGLLKAIEELP